MRCMRQQKTRSLGGESWGWVFKGTKQEFPPTLRSIFGQNTLKTLADPTGSRTLICDFMYRP